MCHSLPLPPPITSGVLTVAWNVTDPTESEHYSTQLPEFRVIPGVVPGVNGVPVRSVTLEFGQFHIQERSRPRLRTCRSTRKLPDPS